VACPIVASDTGPLRDVIEHERNGLLVDFFSTNDILKGVSRLLDHPDTGLKLGETARKDCLEKFDLKSICLPAQVKLLESQI